MSAMTIYAVYLTTYHGNKMPMFYIGSSSLKRINNGYHGSVCSKKYKSIWLSELNNNPHLFKTSIICTTDSRQKSTEIEYRLQKKLNVVKSNMYINMSTASINGFFGMDNSKRIVSEETRKKLSSANKNKIISQKHRDAISKKLKGRVSNRKGVKLTEEQKLEMSIRRKGIPNLKNRGKIVSEETRLKMSIKRKGKKQTQDHIHKRTKNRSQKYIVTFPDGSELEIIGLYKFCKENNLNPCCMSDIVNNRQTQHKGFKIKKSS